MTSAAHINNDCLRARIHQLRIWTARLPLNTPLVHATADAPYLESVVVEVGLDTGVRGRAEVRGNGEYATGEDTPRILKALLTVDLAGGPVDATETIHSLLTESKLAAMALDVAVADASARALDLPLHRYWAPSSVGVTSVRTHAQIGFLDDAVRARHLAAAGFDRLKVRVGTADSKADLARLRDIADAAGPEMQLIVDANAGWSLEQALEVELALRDLPVVWLEQPVATVTELSLLREQSEVPIYADEVARDAATVQALAGMVDGVHLKLEKCGTVASLFETVEAARDAGLAVALGQMDQGRLGCAVTTHLAVALGFPRAELWGCASITRDLTDELCMVDGGVHVPTGAGTGIDRIDTNLLKEVA